MDKAKFIIIPEIYEFEWEITTKTINKIDKIWKNLSEISFFDISEKLNFKTDIIITDSNHNYTYLVYSNLILKKSFNLINLKCDDKKKITNTILCTAPNNILLELMKNINLTRSSKLTTNDISIILKI